jgi:hypothetical protein
MKKPRVPGVMTIREKRAVYLLFMAGWSIVYATEQVGGLVWWGVDHAEQAIRDFANGKLKEPRWTQPRKKADK